MTSPVRVTRRSLTLAAAATVLVGVPLLAGPTASAQTVLPTASLASLDRSDAVGTVTFSGGCGMLGSGLGANSTPDAARVSVPAGSEVRFTNRLGQAATLRLDGEPAAQVPAGGAADVVFLDGPVAASMQISCLIGESAGTVTVEVTRRRAGPSGGGSAKPAPAEPSDEPAEPPSNPPSSAGGDADPGTPSQGGSSEGGSSSGDGAPDGVATGGPSWGGWQPEAAAPPPAGRSEDGTSREGRGTRSRDGDRRPRWGVEVEPPSGGASSGGPDTVDRESGGNELAVDQVSRTSGSAPNDGPVGLLALIATVCVVGVSAGVVRALISQRAHRAEWA